jgi:hypothetical protein
MQMLPGNFPGSISGLSQKLSMQDVNIEVSHTLGLQHHTETVLAAETVSTRNCNHRRLTRSNRPSTEHVL